MSAANERACTRHNQDPYEAEPYHQLGLNYLVLRCPICHRPQGLRLVRKVKSS